MSGNYNLMFTNLMCQILNVWPGGWSVCHLAYSVYLKIQYILVLYFNLAKVTIVNISASFPPIWVKIYF